MIRAAALVAVVAIMGGAALTFDGGQEPAPPTVVAASPTTTPSPSTTVTTVFPQMVLPDTTTETTAAPARTTTTTVALPAPPTTTVGWASARLQDVEESEVVTPTRLVVPTLDIDAPIEALGIDENGKMDIPGNVTDVGWYRHGSLPGEEGSAVLAAHVDLAGSGPGVFFHLDTLEPGDIFMISMSDGSASSYTVESAERVPKSSLDVDTLFDAAGDPVVRLVTCGGAFDRSIRSYSDNVIVTARRTP